MYRFFNLPLYMATDDGAGSGNSDGNSTTVIDWTKFDWASFDPNVIPKDVVKKNAAYKEILDESIQRRQKIAELSKPTKKEAEIEDLPDEKLKDAVVPDNNDIAELKRMVGELTTKISAQESSNLEGWRKLAGEATGIKSPSVLAALQGKDATEVLTNAQRIATELGIPTPVVGSGTSSIGNPSIQRDKGLQTRVQAMLNGADSDEPFDPQFQEDIGGGYSG